MNLNYVTELPTCRFKFESQIQSSRFMTVWDDDSSFEPTELVDQRPLKFIKFGPRTTNMQTNIKYKLA